MKSLIICFLTTAFNWGQPHHTNTKVDWVGHWECYSWTVEGKVLGTLDIEKNGKYYRINYSYTAEEKQEGSSDACPMIAFVMDGEDDGNSTLVTDLFDFQFSYNADMDLIFVSADGSESMFGAANCVGGMFTKVK